MRIEKGLQTQDQASQHICSPPLISTHDGRLIKDSGTAEKVENYLTENSNLRMDTYLSLVRAGEQAKEETLKSLLESYKLGFKLPLPGKEFVEQVGGMVALTRKRAIEIASQDLRRKYMDKFPKLELTSIEQEILRESLAGELTKGLVHTEVIPMDALVKLDIEEMSKPGSFEKMVKVQGTQQETDIARRNFEALKNPENNRKYHKNLIAADIESGLGNAYGTENGSLAWDYHRLGTYSIFAEGMLRRAWEVWADKTRELGNTINTNKKLTVKNGRILFV